MQSVSIIVPCYNEEAVIHESYSRLKRVLDGVTGYSTEIIFINDGSKDCTAEMLSAIAEQDKQVKVLHFSRNFGHQPAVTAGIHHCTSDLAIIIDADLQDPPELIPELLAVQQREQANVVYCVREKRQGESIFKKLTARVFYRSMNYLSEVKFPVDTGDFRLIDRAVMNEFCKFKEKGKYIRGIISWVGFKQVPFYYKRDARFAGETKYPLRKMLNFASTALLYFSTKPLKLSTSLGFIAVLIGIVYAIWTVLGKLLGFTHAISGWSSIIILVVFFGGVQLLTIGVLGQYIGILFDEVKDRPEYIIEKSENC
ncbi:glycosyltransferase family 2 protein [Parabacteroides sp. FAFU027]|uniref:glycosyltransferase family 2 protein n=1 Tax=Parabacteroides sp. FAFU027 TaxID=2922715 RepID=UPI001FB02066|nr:glycosyltransferase family 2 protein [Parabacteroides sp. FAFU027]